MCLCFWSVAHGCSEDARDFLRRVYEFLFDLPIIVAGFEDVYSVIVYCSAVSQDFVPGVDHVNVIVLIERGPRRHCI